MAAGIELTTTKSHVPRPTSRRSSQASWCCSRCCCCNIITTYHTSPSCSSSSIPAVVMIFDGWLGPLSPCELRARTTNTYGVLGRRPRTTPVGSDDTWAARVQLYTVPQNYSLSWPSRQLLSARKNCMVSYQLARFPVRCGACTALGAADGTDVNINQNINSTGESILHQHIHSLRELSTPTRG